MSDTGEPSSADPAGAKIEEQPLSTDRRLILASTAQHQHTQSASLPPHGDTSQTDKLADDNAIPPEPQPRESSLDGPPKDVAPEPAEAPSLPPGGDAPPLSPGGDTPPLSPGGDAPPLSPGGDAPQEPVTFSDNSPAADNPDTKKAKKSTHNTFSSVASSSKPKKGKGKARATGEEPRSATFSPESSSSPFSTSGNAGASSSRYYKPTSGFIHRYPISSGAPAPLLLPPPSSFSPENERVRKEMDVLKKEKEALQKEKLAAELEAKKKSLENELARAKAAAELEAMKYEAEVEAKKRAMKEVGGARSKEEAEETASQLGSSKKLADPKQDIAGPGQKDPIRFTDAVGRKFVFPWHLCKTWKGMEALINQTFAHIAGLGKEVMDGHYDLYSPEGFIVLPQVWETMIQPGWQITMKMWPMVDGPNAMAGPPPPPPPGLSGLPPDLDFILNGSKSKKKKKQKAPPPPPPPGLLDIPGMPPPPPLGSSNIPPPLLPPYGPSKLPPPPPPGGPFLPGKSPPPPPGFSFLPGQIPPPPPPSGPSYPSGLGPPPPPPSGPSYPSGLGPPPPPPGLLSLGPPPASGKDKKKKSSSKNNMLMWAAGGGPSARIRKGSKSGPPPTGLFPLSPFWNSYGNMVDYLSGGHMPHLQTVRCGDYRHERTGKLVCYDTLLKGGAPKFIDELDLSRDLRYATQQQITSRVASFRPTRPRDYRRRTIIVEDLSPVLIEALGASFRMNPEFFEEHLNRSGYRSKSYEDPHPRTWSTNAAPKDYVSVRWFRPVFRDKNKRISDKEREDLLRTGDDAKSIVLDWEKDSDTDSTLRLGTNIFRREWPLAANTSALLPADDDKTPVAWEERATMHSSQVDGCSVVIILLDPLPVLESDSDDSAFLPEGTRHVPFQQAYSRAPTGPGLGMVGIFDGARDLEEKLRRLSPYFNNTESTTTDLTQWIRQGNPLDLEDSNLDTITALLWVIHRDIVGFIILVSNALLEIGVNSTDDYLMQKQLLHWRGLITGFQVELPEIRASLDTFVRFANELQPLDVAGEFIRDTLTQIDILIGQNEKSYAALRADMALLENKRGIAQAESVTKLTELGFFFLPVTCVAGLFSMNVEQLASPAPLGSFLGGVVVAVCIAYLIRLTIRSSTLAELKKEHAGNIRDHANLPHSSRIPTRAVLAYMLPKWMGEWRFDSHRMRSRAAARTRLSSGWWRKGLLGLVYVAVLMVPVALVWTHKHLDPGFKGMVTVLVFVFDVILVVSFLGYPVLSKRLGHAPTLSSTVTSVA